MKAKSRLKSPNIIVTDGEILAEEANQVTQIHDLTAHAEIVAIRATAARLATENFTGYSFDGSN
jgi:tRNA(Arg) A34 adenosine deaminase TadA